MATSDTVVRDHVPDLLDINFTSVDPQSLSTTVPDAAVSEVIYVTSQSVFIFFLIVGFASNCCLIATFVRRRRRRRSAATKSSATAAAESAFTSAHEPTSLVLSTSASLPSQLEILIIGIMSVSNLINCVVNGIWLTYAIQAVATGLHPPSNLCCGIDAAFVQLVSMVYVVGLMLSFVDRYVALRSAAAASNGCLTATTTTDIVPDFNIPQNHRHGLPVKRTAIFIALAWALTTSFSVPLAVPVESGGIQVDTGGGRYLCAVAPNSSSHVYTWMAAIVGYLCPLGVVLGMLVGCAVVVFRAHKKQAVGRIYASRFAPTQASLTPTQPPTRSSLGSRNNSRSRNHDRFSTSSSSSSATSASLVQETAASLAAEWSAAKYLVALCVTWCAMVGSPFLLLSFIRGISMEGWTSGNAFIRSTMLTYSSGHAVVTWLFLSHPIALPLITYIWMKKYFITCCLSCCRQTSTATSASGCDAVISSTNRNSPQSRWLRQKTSPKHRQRVGIYGDTGSLSKRSNDGLQPVSTTSPMTTASGRHPVATIPVLFATSDGLHVHRPVSDCTPSLSTSLPQSARPTSNASSVAMTSPVKGSRHDVMTAVQCDVFGSFYSTDILDDEDDDDYNNAGVDDKDTAADVSSRGDGAGVDDLISENTSDYDSGDSISAGDEVPATPTAAVIEVKTLRTIDRSVNDGVLTVHRVSCDVETEVRAPPTRSGKNKRPGAGAGDLVGGRRRAANSSAQILNRDDSATAGDGTATKIGRGNSIAVSQLVDNDQSILNDSERSRTGTGEALAASGGAPSRRDRVGIAKGPHGQLHQNDQVDQTFPVLATVSRESMLATVYGGSRKTKSATACVNGDTELVHRTSNKRGKLRKGDRKKNKHRAKVDDVADETANTSRNGMINRTQTENTISVAATNDNNFDTRVPIDFESGQSDSRDCSSAPSQSVVQALPEEDAGIKRSQRHQNARRSRSRQTSESRTNLLSPQLDSSNGSTISASFADSARTATEQGVGTHHE